MSLKHPPFLYLLLLHLFPYVRAINYTQPYNPDELILLDCGSASSSTSLDGRNWDGDARSKFLPSHSQASSSAFSASQPDSSLPKVPYSTARIFHSSLTYTFPLSPGPKFVRLYFYPTAYSNLTISRSFFSLTANHYLLLKNFSALLTLHSMDRAFNWFTKEYMITIRDNQQLDLTFSASPGSFGFINGIEIVSIPDNLYAKGNDNPLNLVGVPYDFYLDDSTALETFYRLNVGGNDISGSGDSGMYRTWVQDIDFLSDRFIGTVIYSGVSVNGIQYTPATPAYTAPESVYTSARSMGKNFSANDNLTWSFSVDAGFHYLVRLHFCETRKVVSSEMLEIFEIFINNQTAERDADVIHWSGGNSIPVYRDHVVLIPQGKHSKQDLWLTLRPNFDLKPMFADAILNGLEIFKLNNSDGSLAGSNSEATFVPPPRAVPVPTLHERKKSFSKLGIVVGSVTGVILVLSLVIFVFVSRKRRVVLDSAKSQAKSFQLPLSHTLKSNVRNISLRPSIPFRRFSIFEIEVATTRFDDELIIGSGGFGNVYKGYIDDGTTPVAVKRLHSSSRQGAREFKTEIQLLAKLHNPHLVALVGYCNDPGEMILVYEYMQRGTLRDHLYKTRNTPIPWKKRLEICIGAAKGLNYLHTAVKPPIIHRDVKSTNILIDENWVARVSDFGLSRTGPTSNSQTHVSTVVRGSFGYVDPEYYRRQHLTEKSDVYSFGVVLLEVLCARPPVIPGLPKEQVNLADWARFCFRRGAFNQIIDPNLMGDISPFCLEKFGEIVDSCLRDQGTLRPSMSDVVFGLELVLQLQESNEESMTGGGCSDRMTESGSPRTVVRREAVTTDDDDLFSGSGVQKEESKSSFSNNQSDPVRLKSATVFSEIMSPKGR